MSKIIIMHSEIWIIFFVSMWEVTMKKSVHLRMEIKISQILIVDKSTHLIALQGNKLVFIFTSFFLSNHRCNFFKHDIKNLIYCIKINLIMDRCDIYLKKQKQIENS